MGEQLTANQNVVGSNPTSRILVSTQKHMKHMNRPKRPVRAALIKTRSQFGTLCAVWALRNFGGGGGGKRSFRLKSWKGLMLKHDVKTRFQKDSPATRVSIYSEHETLGFSSSLPSDCSVPVWFLCLEMWTSESHRDIEWNLSEQSVVF